MTQVEVRAGAPVGAVSWASIGAGSVVAAGASLILLSLGSGLGLASISPWADRGLSAGAVSVAAAIWLIVTQWVASALGGYLAGRLRTRWSGTHHHEVFFRDTAHGLITWALSTVVLAVWVATAVSGAVGGGVRAAAQAVPATAEAALANGEPAEYAIDRLFRPAERSESSPPAGPAERAEAAHVLAKFWVDGTFSDADRQYLTALVAARTSLSAPAAQKRVDDLVAGAVEARMKVQAKSDAARKAAAQSSVYLSLALLIGAFVASVSAALGGRLRDQHA